MYAHSGFEKEWVDRFLGKDCDITCVMDIGSFDGGDALRFNGWYPDAKVYAIEATPCNFNAMINKVGERENLECFNVAMSDKNEPVVFNQYLAEWLNPYDSRKEKMVMGTMFNQHDWKLDAHNMSRGERVEVQGITFDSFCEKSDITEVDIAHVDIEGASYKMVCGMNKVLPKMLYMEQQGPQFFEDQPHTNDDLHHLLAAKGYKLVLIFPNDFLYVHLGNR